MRDRPGGLGCHRAGTTPGAARWMWATTSWSRVRALMAANPIIGDVRGLGLYIGIELVGDPVTLRPAGEEAAYIANRMRDLGVLISTDGPYHNVLKIKPPIGLQPRQRGPSGGEVSRGIEGRCAIGVTAVKTDHRKARRHEGDRVLFFPTPSCLRAFLCSVPLNYRIDSLATRRRWHSPAPRQSHRWVLAGSDTR